MTKLVITGGQCAGKTGVIEELAKLGLVIVPEAPLKVILDEEKKQKPILPWLGRKQQLQFQRLVARQQLELEQNVPAGNVFLDRSLIDIKAWNDHFGIPNPRGISEKIREANYVAVFFLETLPPSYWKKTKNGKPRSMTYQQGQQITRELLETYQKICAELKIPLIQVPVIIGARKRTVLLLHKVDWVLRRCELNHHRFLSRRLRPIKRNFSFRKKSRSRKVL